MERVKMTTVRRRQVPLGTPDKTNVRKCLLGTPASGEAAFALDSREPSVMRNKALDGVRRLRRATAGGAEEAGSIQDLLLELFEREINRWGNVKRNELRNDESADHNQTQRAPGCAIRAKSQRDGQSAHQCRE